MMLHPGARWVFRTRFFIFFTVLGLFVFIYLIQIFPNVLLYSIIYFALVMILTEIYARLSYSNWKYEFTSTELKIEKGIIMKTYKTVPYERIQNVEISRGIFARMFGFSALAIHTAGYSGRGGGGMLNRYESEGSIPGVSPETAEKLRDWLSKKIGKGSGM